MSKETENKNQLIDKLKITRKYSRKQAFQEELLAYLSAKLEKHNVPTDEIMEIAQYVLIGNDFVVRDEVEKAYSYWNRQIKKGTRRTKEEINGGAE